MSRWNKSQARIPWACTRRNCAQFGPAPGTAGVVVLAVVCAQLGMNVSWCLVVPRGADARAGRDGAWLRDGGSSTPRRGVGTGPTAVIESTRASSETHACDAAKPKLGPPSLSRYVRLACPSVRQQPLILAPGLVEHRAVSHDRVAYARVQVPPDAPRE